MKMNLLIISNEEIKGIMKKVKSFEESGLLVEGVSETIENETVEQKGMLFLDMSSSTLATSLLEIG